MKMHLPNYKDGSIVNLMSTIERALGGKPAYAPLKIFKPEEVKGYKNVVLIIIDGLGYEYLKKHGKGTFFQEHLRGPITSVFPSTTAAGVTTFMTGVAPQQHVVMGWFTFLKELGTVSTILPFVPRHKGKSFGSVVDPKLIFNEKAFVKKIKANSFCLQPPELLESDYTLAHMDMAKRIGYNGMAGFFNTILKAMRAGRRSKKKNFIYAYWPDFDTAEHEFGPKSSQVKKHFIQLEKKFASFAKKIEGTDSIVILTADHGQVDVPPKDTTLLENHPKLAETLTLPLCGESRVAYCYVHPSKAKQFERYAKTKLGSKCWVFKSEDLFKKNYFGMFKPHPRLMERIGDYMLIMKKSYAIKDQLINEKRRLHLGRHGGVSKEEMFVPLIVIKDKK